MATQQETTLPSRAAIKLKTPKGTRDWFGMELLRREEMLQIITKVFQRHGALPLDTPVFELRSVLAGKYGEEGARLVYDLADQGGELCSLRYDLTVPFARFLATRRDAAQARRYQVAKVYRRDQPSLARGRLREFVQCDFDVAGAAHDGMVADAEVVRVAVEVLEALGVEVVVKINHRAVLDGLFAVCGVPADKIRGVSSAVDKLDKVDWAEVRREIVADKGVEEAVADRIGTYVGKGGSGLREMVAALKEDVALMKSDDVKAGLDDLGLLAPYLEALAVIDKVEFDVSLARGLDYYTGLIFEVIPKPSQHAAGGDAQALQVGSIAAGGRYDNLVGMYGKEPVPCVGISFGVDRIFTLLESRRTEPRVSDFARKMDVYVVVDGDGDGGDGLLPERMAVAAELWDADIKAEYLARASPKVPQQLRAARVATMAVILDRKGLEAGTVRVKNGAEENLVLRENMVEEVRRLM